MSDSPFKYCPFCGGHIPQNGMVKFCPFCGGNLALTNHKQQETQSKDDAVLQSHVALETVCKNKIEHTPIYFDEYNKIKLQQCIESEYYSIILKDAPNKKNLLLKLEKVLVRGYFAIRLAIDNIPSIIIYKARGSDIMYLNEIFIQEEASTSMVEGDVKETSQLDHFLANVHAKEQHTLKRLPMNLWMGDTIRGVFSHLYMENCEGIIVITDQNIYFVPNDKAVSYQWFVKSYQLLTKIEMVGTYLELSYKDVPVTKIVCSDKGQLVDVYQCIYTTVQL